MKKDYKAHFIIGGLIVAAFALMWFGSRSTAEVSKTIADPSALAGLQTSTAPWPPELNHFSERLRAIGLPALTAEGAAIHIHQHLDLFIHGKPIVIPQNIGINTIPLVFAPIHVHDTTGIIHVESPTIQTFTLGQFFDIWGVRLTSDCVGGYCTDATSSSLKIFLNGTPYTGDPRTVALTSHQEIVVAYGTENELPKSIPSSYSFPPNY